MILKIQNPKVYDNTDGDLIIINKSKLSNHLHFIQKFYFSSGTILGWLGLSSTFGVSSYVVEKFKELGPFSGDVVRSVFVLCSIVTFGFFIYTFQNWLRFRKNHNPEMLVGGLLGGEPHELKSIISDEKISGNQKK